MKALRRLAHIVWRSISETAFVWITEINYAFRDEAVWVFMILVPLGYPLLYSYIYNNEIVRDVPVAVVDKSHSAISREYIRLLDAAELTKVARQPNDLSTAQELMKTHKVYGILYIPASFSKDLSSGRQTTVYEFSDASTLLYYRQFTIANTNVSLALNRNIKIAAAGNTTSRQDDITASPLKYEEVDLFNPQMGIASYLIPGVLMLILQQTMLLGMGIIAGTMREKNAFRLFQPLVSHSGGTLEVVLGRSLCYIPLYIANAFYVLGIVPIIFHFNRLAHFGDVIIFMVPYLLAISFFAQVISHFIKTRESCMLVILFMSLVFLFVSGISWPWSAVPDVWKVLGCLIPSTFGINGFVRMTNEGASLAQVAFEYRGLWLQALGYLVLAIFLVRRDIRSSTALFKRQHRRYAEKSKKIASKRL